MQIQSNKNVLRNKIICFTLWGDRMAASDQENEKERVQGVQMCYKSHLRFLLGNSLRAPGGEPGCRRSCNLIAWKTCAMKHTE